MIYHMATNGATTGKSGKNYTWKPGRSIEAPADEFDHLPERHFDTSRSTLPAEKAQLVPESEKAVLKPDATDSAIKFAADSGIDLTSVSGTGAGGRITLGDVKAAAGE